MKTKLLILLLFMFLFFVTKAQHYYPLPDSNVTWIVQQDDGFGSFYYWELHSDSLHNDTIINLKTYTKIFTGTYFQGAYRSDTSGFTYFVPLDSTQEFILIDLTKNTGDTIKNILFGLPNIFSGTGYLLIDLIIDSVNFTSAGPYMLKRMFLSNHILFPQPYSYIIWIEKIGTNPWGLFNTLSEFGFGSCNLYCMQYIDTVYYHNSYPYPFYANPVYYSGQCNIPVDVENYDNIPTEISVYPNPFSDEITISNIEEENNFTVKIYNTLGQIVFTKRLETAYADSYSINLENITSGIFFLVIENKNDILLSEKIIKYLP